MLTQVRNRWWLRLGYVLLPLVLLELFFLIISFSNQPSGMISDTLTWVFLYSLPSFLRWGVAGAYQSWPLIAFQIVLILAVLYSIKNLRGGRGFPGKVLLSLIGLIHAWPLVAVAPVIALGMYRDSSSGKTDSTTPQKTPQSVDSPNDRQSFSKQALFYLLATAILGLIYYQVLKWRVGVDNIDSLAEGYAILFDLYIPIFLSVTIGSTLIFVAGRIHRDHPQASRIITTLPWVLSLGWFLFFIAVTLAGI